MIDIFFVNNEGAGFAETISIEDGTKLADFFAAKFSNGKPENYKIQVNRQIATADYIIQAKDRITVCPTKIQGA